MGCRSILWAGLTMQARVLLVHDRIGGLAGAQQPIVRCGGGAERCDTIY